jgi:hypothetical protein
VEGVVGVSVEVGDHARNDDYVERPTAEDLIGDFEPVGGRGVANERV